MGGYVLFANYKTMVVNVDGQGVQKGKNKAQGGKRVMYTCHHPCWDAKNRYGLPEECEFDYAVIARIIEQGQVSAEKAQEQSPVMASTQKSAEEKTEQPDFMNIPDNAGEQMEFDMSHPGQTIKNKGAVLREEGTEAPLPRDSIFHVDDRIPKALRDLMEEKLVSEEELQKVVARQGYYPQATPIPNYDPDFISGVLVGAWPQVYHMIEQLRESYEIPFD